MALKKATTVGRRARLSLEGLSGSGKTTTALKIAMGLLAGTTKRIAVLDTEEGRSELEAKWVDFDVDIIGRDRLNPEAGTKAVQATYDYGVLIIDSGSGFWGEALNIKDDIASGAKENGYTAWGKINPRLEAMINAILRHPGHTIVNYRSKMKHEINVAEKKVERIGVEPVARPGAEYDYDLSFEIDHRHVLRLTKPARGAFAEHFGEFWKAERPGPEIGELIIRCLAELGEVPELPKAETFEGVKDDIKRFGAELGDKASIVRRGRPITNLAQAIEVRDDLWKAVEQRRASTRILEEELAKRDAGTQTEKQPPAPEAPKEEGKGK